MGVADECVITGGPRQLDHAAGDAVAPGPSVGDHELPRFESAEHPPRSRPVQMARFGERLPGRGLTRMGRRNGLQQVEGRIDGLHIRLSHHLGPLGRGTRVICVSQDLTSPGCIGVTEPQRRLPSLHFQGRSTRSVGTLRARASVRGRPHPWNFRRSERRRCLLEASFAAIRASSL
jgi:hypothetical protein